MTSQREANNRLFTILHYGENHIAHKILNFLVVLQTYDGVNPVQYQIIQPF